MNETIDKAIEKMAEMTKANAKHDEAMKYSQAALNLAHTKMVLAGIEIQAAEAAAMNPPKKKKRAGA